MRRRGIIGDLLRRASVTAPDLLAADIAAALHEWVATTSSSTSSTSSSASSPSASPSTSMLMPPVAFPSPALAIAGILEPTYFVAGDAFDYSMNGELFGFAILDAMGHGVHSTLASTSALGAFRHGRRRALELPVIAEQIDDALIEHLDGDGFVTGHICRLDVATGAFCWVNAGHPRPLHIRGAEVVGEMDAAPCLPLGLGIDITEIGAVNFQPGGRVLFYSDGVVEARPKGGPEFGVERLIDDAEEFLGSSLPV